ncbi:hypothetical protein BAUCODRAFT_29145 [Baudoinia panamericana UAMH 10762]|uniref:Uncharacterized protein n=1 Tax=Baudoinia panamericana (strain UAMH 10762) TaxID=717646 RepID=M2M162_BAUPA|nr:uncharacterized protein BAUCODRAFT_29145 [Baudoinia panamericana UAMH 10762]EMD00778.1 hypothetical protein BAUCODRAFT_29145 [Baudoinia panamericana UAMH 10762]
MLNTFNPAYGLLPASGVAVVNLQTRLPAETLTNKQTTPISCHAGCRSERSGDDEP